MAPVVTGVTGAGRGRSLSSGWVFSDCVEMLQKDPKRDSMMIWYIFYFILF